ncbi:3-hydroxyacyl-CoA dehydrogenase family protein [Cupriavidus basilensis]
MVATLMDLGRRMGKTAVLARVYPGFIGNALFRNYTREAHFLVEEGALPHEVDQA